MTQSHLIVTEEGLKIYKDDPASAILCEDQERAKDLIAKNHFNGNLLWDMMKIGSIYLVPGIEFEVINSRFAKDDLPVGEKCARLIEHTAEKGESPEIDREIPEPIAFANWIKENRFMPDVISGEWIRKFGYKDPEVKTTSELYHFFKVIEI